MNLNRVHQRWLDAYSDPHSHLYTFSKCMALADLHGNGEYKLVLADLGTGTSNIKLKVFKGTSLMSENTLIEIPTALVSFYHDNQDQKIPSIALASGSSLYIYRNMKPYFKFSLPDLDINPLEIDLWMQARNEGISPTVLHGMLDTIKSEIGFSNMSFQSQKLLMIPIKNEEELEGVVKLYAPLPIKRQTVITCLTTLFKNSSCFNSVSCLVIGTENGWIHIIDSEAFTILESIDQSLDIQTTDQTVPVVVKALGMYDVDYRIIVCNRNGKITLLKRGWTQPKCILNLSIQAVDMCLMPDSGNIFLALMDSSLECYSKKGRKLWNVKLPSKTTGLLSIPLLHQGLTLIAVALEGGNIHFYNGREMVDSIMATDTIAGMVFGRFGQEEHCLVLITISGTLQVKVLKRTAQFYQQNSMISSKSNRGQNIKLDIPKKTSLFLEQTNREINESTQIHQTFQKNILQFRLDAAREFYNSLTKINNSISNDSAFPLKLSTEVFGLGPTFKILLTLENMTQSPYNIDNLLNKTLGIVFNFNDKIYDVETPYIRVPFVVPGLPYKFETKVYSVTDSSVTDEIHVFVVTPSSSDPLLSAIVHMPICDVLPVEV